ncbi:hypothetical protein [Nonomuraea wenchangensis]|uniref:Uncharacterized protein n=1 Tax=Nonomuraea wenchangensis TaxID=568860 RepID=A0A1I0EES5_9ACTN|nr:hypothetical protein [Nonomuraea wenchangensis]SET43667.1 hypothetical protein SAMN05421811_10320 [Nonomuraea wenchangensis]
MNKRARSEKIIRSFRNGRKPNRSGRPERVRGGKRLVFTAEPGYIRSSAGEIIGVDAWVELYDESGREIPIDPHRRIVNPPTVPRSGEDDPYEAFIEAVWDSVESAPYPRGWRTAGTVTTVFGDTADGRLEGQGATYTVARQGTGTIQIDTTGVTSATGQFFSSTYSCYQQFWSFDTSAITDTDEVTGVTLELYQTGQNLTGGNFTVEAREFDWGTSLTTADFRQGSTLASLPLLASIATSGMGTLNRYYAFTSTSAFLTASGLKTGSVRLLTTSSKQRTGTAPTDREFVQFATAEASGTTTDPKLTITHGDPNAVRFIGASHANSLNGVMPSNTQSGDMLIAIIQASQPPTGPTGWTKLGDDRTANGYTANVWYIVRGASNPDLSWANFGVNPSTDIVAYRNAGSAPHVWAQSSAGSSVAPSVTTTAASTVLVALHADYQAAASVPSGMTERTVSADFNRIADLAVPSTGATGTKTFGGTTPMGAWSIVLAQAGSSEDHSGGSSTSVSHTASGAGRASFSGSSSTSISVTSSAGGSVAFSAGSGTSATVSVSASGSPGPSSGSGTPVSVNVASAGSPGFLGGSDVTVEVVATGGGQASSDASGGSSSVVSVTVSGAGSAAFSNGSETSLTHVVTGSGSASAAGGSSVVVTHSVSGGGIVLVVDISIEIAPTVVIRRFELGTSKIGIESDDNRLSASSDDNRARELVTMASSSVRERVSVESTRLLTEIGEDRLGKSVDPSRVTRME